MQQVIKMTATTQQQGSQTAQGPVRVFIVDDHAVVRQGTREMLNTNNALMVVGEADSGDGLLERLQMNAPELVLLDINLPGQNGLELLSIIKSGFPQLKVILFSAHSEAQYIRRAQQLHADGYLTKTATEQELVAAIVKICREGITEPVYSADVADKIREQAEAGPEPKLTPREMEILLLVSKGLTNQAIAKDLFLSVKTVDTHVANLMKKLEVNKRTQLMAYAYEQGLIQQ